MATLASNQTREYKLDPYYKEEYPVIASDIIYAGAAVTLNSSGDARPANVSDEFAGFCMAKIDNSTGSAGDLSVEVRTKGKVKLSVTGVSDKTSYGDTVYLTDDDTFTLTATGGLAIGKVDRYVTGSTVWVDFEGVAARSI